MNRCRSGPTPLFLGACLLRATRPLAISRRIATNGELSVISVYNLSLDQHKRPYMGSSFRCARKRQSPTQTLDIFLLLFHRLICTFYCNSKTYQGPAYSGAGMMQHFRRCPRVPCARYRCECAYGIQFLRGY